MSTSEHDTSALLHVRIPHKSEIARRIFRFDLAPTASATLPPFTAGAHIGVHVPNGMTRKHSLCSPSDDVSRYTIAVKRNENSAGGSKALVDLTHEGDELTITHPSNDFPLVPQATNTLLIAGGIGITPLYAMFQYIKQHTSGRVKLIYLTRDKANTAFYDALTQADVKSDVIIHHDDGNSEKAYDLWPLLEKPMGRHVYCCSPRPLMDAVRDMTGHWPSTSVHFEDFGTTTAAHHKDDRPFRIHLARSHKTIDVPANVTILDALRAHGIHTPSSCESGSCGSCKTRLLKGEADHRDLVLAPHKQKDYIIVCVLRARGDELELDV